MENPLRLHIESIKCLHRNRGRKGQECKETFILCQTRAPQKKISSNKNYE